MMSRTADCAGGFGRPAGIHRRERLWQLKKIVPIVAKIGISAALIGFLGWKASRDASLPRLIEGAKDWSLLGLALLAVFLAVLITILRWHLLLRTLGLQFTLRESLRAGFVGYLFNL